MQFVLLDDAASPNSHEKMNRWVKLVDKGAENLVWVGNLLPHADEPLKFVGKLPLSFYSLLNVSYCVLG